MKRSFILCFLTLLVFDVGAQYFITENAGSNDFPIVTATGVASIFVEASEDTLIHKTAALLQKDIEKVTGKTPRLVDKIDASNNVIIIGTVGRMTGVRQLMKNNRIDASVLKGKWEAFKLQNIRKPFRGVQNALIIIGSDRRGAAYGVVELSRQMGVSPWYWWADVPVRKQKEVYFKNGVYNYPSPSVKYRGIFINDEAPAFSGWTKEKFGGFNHKMYEHLFELLLRLKANYLWPAMWGNAFNDDDTLNPVLAHRWGIVMGTSHHEPMLRAQTEWKRYGKGAWDYERNEKGLQSFWKKGIENMRGHESILTIGMRGDGDEPMTTRTATALLERIVKDQRKIVEEVTGKPASETPQLWALYKEVQDYYDKGMRVPDDVTLLLCDDNWGNIRRLPDLNAEPRKGGYGIYYHFDYVGGPRNYKWINTNNIARVWEQMHLAYEHNARQVWIVNVGDLKPMELPTSFFLDYAWNVDNWNEDNLSGYYLKWATQQFGGIYAKEIARILATYAQYASRRKPELLDAKSYSITNYNEANRVAEAWNLLQKKAEEINARIPQEQKSAFYQLVLYPVKAYGNLQHMYTALAWNDYYAKRNNLLANKYAGEAIQFYKNDSLITVAYHQLNNGKWNHMMSQKHIGYTSWQEPAVQKMPEVRYVKEGSVRNAESTVLSTPPASPGIAGDDKGPAFYEKDGYVSITASNFTRKKEQPGIAWKLIPGIGREGDGITTFPVTRNISRLSKNKPQLQYDFYTSGKGNVKLNIYTSPTLNYTDSENGLQYAISIDDGEPQIVSINKFKVDSHPWARTVSDNINITDTDHRIDKEGKHTLKYWMISPGVVLQKLVVDMGGLKQSYLGPPETKIENR
ncbi:glycosyl hydrolase 115 family protein [Niabella beijingensis]|uniref:glycosyl hydrolase 115 family protein n=1 Tax=Niabella beijingensis TaxID=2872700 RepID=UPI001CC1B6B4|nr:glycosyl hydrolase 115 family protein [Niabella beijingensis]MBZ4191986.1 glycosyl hydrolase 115 family protein [Niabella beijingensis]